MKNLGFALILFICGLAFSQNIDSLKIKQIQKELDSIEYSEKDFTKFKKHYSINKIVFDSISKKRNLERSVELEFLELLDLSFEDAKIKYGETNLKMAIYTYYKSIEILEKFKKLDSAFLAANKKLEDQNRPFDKKTEFSDSLRKEIEKYKEYVDSLKKN